MYKKNVGTLDAVLRVGIGVGLIYTGFFATDLIDDSVASMILGVAGVIILVSGIFSRCPLYDLIGFNSCSHNSDD